MACDHRFASRRVGHLRLIAVEAGVGGQTGLQAIAHEQFGLFVGWAVKADGETHFPANAAGMLAEGTNNAVAGLDGPLGKQRVAALGANGRTLLFHLLVDEGEHLERRHAFRRPQVGAIPHRAAVGRVELEVRTLTNQDAVVELLEVAINGEREGAVAARFLLDHQHRHHVPVPLQPSAGHYFGQHLERGDDADRWAFVVACTASKDDAPLNARGEVGSNDINVCVQRDGLTSAAIACAGDDVEQVGTAGVGFFRG